MRYYPTHLFYYHPLQTTFLNKLNAYFKNFTHSLNEKIEANMSLEEVEKEFEEGLKIQKLTITFDEKFKPFSIERKTYTDVAMPLIRYDVEILHRQYKYSFTGNPSFFLSGAIHHPYVWGEPMPWAYFYKDYLLFEFEADNNHPNINQIIHRQLMEVDTKLKTCIEAQNSDIDEYIKAKKPEIKRYYKKVEQLNKIMKYLF
jgi:hypothetical protein